VAVTSIDYDAWAQRYDDTRGASPSVLRPLLETLGPAAGRSLLDIGGGTGNYSAALVEAGFAVTHCDPSAGMVRRTLAKLADRVDAAVADGQWLPFRDESFDCAVAIKVLNHVADRHAFAREARRVTRSGPLVLVLASKESIAANWICHYVPSLLVQERFEPKSETIDALRAAGYSSVDVGQIRYMDMADGSAQALKRFPKTFMTDEHIMNTSLFSRLPERERDEALAAVRRDHASGSLWEVIAEYEELSEKHGDGTMFVARG
jgi:ubiquinone/menaquinone biosynthesis C-methylase UbiE